MQCIGLNIKKLNDMRGKTTSKKTVCTLKISLFGNVILTKEFMNSISVDIIWDILFVVLFIYIAILCVKNIRKLRNIKIDSLSVRRAVITEKQSVKSKDLINRSRNRFVAAKIDDNVTLYAMCSQKEYERTMVNKSIGLFFTLGDDTIRVIVL